MKAIFITIAIVVAAFGSAAADQPSGAKALEQGKATLDAGSPTDALASFEAAFVSGYMPHEAAFGAAEAAARIGDSGAASDWLTKAAKSGFRDYDRVRRAEAFRGLLEDDSFSALVDHLDRRAHPCASVEHRSLDFWIGEWTVRDTNTGNPAGRSRIERDMDGCVVMENWTGRTGWTGRSFNVYRADTGRWRQTWADSSGQIYDFVGVPSENRMVFTRETTTAEGATRSIRMTLSKDDAGNVRQMSERSDDGGKSWEVNYDFTYGRSD